MPVFNVPVQWTHWGIHEIEAETKEQAIHFANFLPLPSQEELVKDSFKVLVENVEEVKPVADPEYIDN